MNYKQALDLDKHSITLHVQHTVFLVPFLPLRRDYNVKLPNFMLYGGQLIDIRRYSPLQWNPEKLRNIWQIEFNQWNKIKCGLKTARACKWLFSLLLPIWLLSKLPIKIRELRTAMLCKVDLKLARNNSSLSYGHTTYRENVIKLEIIERG